MQAQIKRQVKNFVGDNISEEELERLARDPAAAEAYRMQQLQGAAVGVHSDVKEKLDAIRQQHEDVIRLEASVDELQALF